MVNNEEYDKTFDVVKIMDKNFCALSIHFPFSNSNTGAIKAICRVSSVEEFLMAPVSFENGSFKEELGWETFFIGEEKRVDDNLYLKLAEPLGNGALYVVYYTAEGEDKPHDRSFFFRVNEKENMLWTDVFPNNASGDEYRLSVPRVSTSDKKRWTQTVLLDTSKFSFQNKFSLARELFSAEEFDSFMKSKESSLDNFFNAYFDLAKDMLKDRLLFPSLSRAAKENVTVTAYPSFAPIVSPLDIAWGGKAPFSVRDILLEKDEKTMKEWLSTRLEKEMLETGLETTCLEKNVRPLSFPQAYETYTYAEISERLFQIKTSEEIPGSLAAHLSSPTALLSSLSAHEEESRKKFIKEQVVQGLKAADKAIAAALEKINETRDELRDEMCKREE